MKVLKKIHLTSNNKQINKRNEYVNCNTFDQRKQTKTDQKVKQMGQSYYDTKTQGSQMMIDTTQTHLVSNKTQQSNRNTVNHTPVVKIPGSSKRLAF